MPYISNIQRENFQTILDSIREKKILNPGEINYLITSIFKIYIEDHGLNYQRINDCLGAAEGAKLELYRRVAAKYEDEKIKQNGDVY